MSLGLTPWGLQREGAQMKWANLLAGFFVIGMAPSAFAGPIISNLIDNGTLVKTTYAPPPSNTTDGVASPYGASTATLTPVINGSDISYKLSVSPSAAFLASANNLAGGKTVDFGGTLSFDITFDEPVFLTTNLSESGVYSVSGTNSRVGF